jgi:exodeoxyribonuclease VII small subunit
VEIGVGALISAAQCSPLGSEFNYSRHLSGQSTLDEKGLLPYFWAVSNAPKGPGQAVAKETPVQFEEALKKLETIVEAMESSEMPLDTLLAKYEEGTQLARICQTKLAEAEVKIQRLEQTSAGEMKLERLSPEVSED